MSPRAHSEGGARVLDEPAPERWFVGHPDLQEAVRSVRGAAAGQRVGAVLRAELIRRARTDPDAFLEYCIDVPGGGPARQGWMQRQWQRLIGLNPRLIVVAPRNHWKTGQSLCRAIWELGRNPNLLIKILGQSDDKAIEKLSVIRKHLTENPRVHQVFPWLKPPTRGQRDSEWNKHRLEVARTLRAPDPSIAATGITSSASGGRANLLIADDCVDRRNSITLPKVRQSIRESWDDWVNLLGPEGRIIYICTLWHQADLTHDLLANPEWSVAWYEITAALGAYVRLPDGQDWSSPEPLWGLDPDCPEHGAEYHGISQDEWREVHLRRLARRWPADGPPPCELGKGGQVRLGESSCRCGPWTRKALEGRRVELGRRQFARGFSNRPIADEERRVLPEWIRYYDDPVPASWERLVCFDTASSQGSRSDYTGGVVAAVDPLGGFLRVVSGRHWKATFPAKLRIVQRTAEVHRPAHILFELAAGGRELAEWFAVNTNLPIRGVTARGSKVERLDQITPYLESGRILFPRWMDPSLPWTKDVGNLLRELLDLPLAEHEDIADAFVHLVRYATLVYEALSLPLSSAVPSGASGQEGGGEEDEEEDDGSGSRLLVF